MTASTERRLPRNLGHRGARGLAPENTLAGFLAGLQAGADGFEFDVQRTSDGHLVIFHDDTLNRITGAEGRVVDSTLEQLRHLDAGSHFDQQFAGEPIPTLDEVIETVPGDSFLNIEAKRMDWSSDGLETALAQAVKHHDLYGRCLVSSFNPIILWRIGRLDRRIPLGLLYEPTMPLGLGRAWPRHFLRLAALHPHFRQIDAGLVHYARGRGWQVNTWTVNEPQDMQHMIDLGIDAIITDRPDLLRSLLLPLQDQAS